MNIFLLLSTSFISGLYTSLWGAYKDSPYESFKYKTFPRSILFSIIIFSILYSIPYFKEKLISLNLIQVFLLIMGIERISSEIYKGFFRKESQQKYFIPSRISFFGNYINDTRLYCAGISLIICAIALLSLSIKTEDFTSIFLVSFLAGLFCAAGGAYKDSPFEGFEPLKFFRSPLVLALISPIFYYFDPVPLGFLIFMNWGLERFIVEYYKTYIQRNMSGKFKPDTQIIQESAKSRQKYSHMAKFIILGFFILLFHELRHT